MSQLICKDIALGYEKKEIVSGLSFNVEKGDYLCIVGENGAGKTTLMKTILGLHESLRGEVVFGEGVEKNTIGYLPQQTIVQKDFPASVWEIVLSGCQGRAGLHPFYRRDDRKLAQACIEKLGISDLSRSCYRDLSGGQQQRVLLARALCAARKMLVLDEPLTGLDPLAASDMYETIEKINRDEGMTVIMVSHDIESSVKYADHILHVGDMIFFGTRDEYLKSEEGRAFTDAKGGAQND